MEKDYKNSRNGYSSEEKSSSRHRRYEDDYTPHYSDQDTGKPSQRAARPSQESRRPVNRRNQSELSEAFNDSRERSHERNASTAKKGSARQSSMPKSEMAGKGKASSQPQRKSGTAPSKKARGAKKNKHMVGRVLAVIQGILSLIVLGLIFALDVLPMKFLAVFAVMLLVLWVFAFFSQFTKSTHIVGKVESFILCIVLALGGYYLFITNSFLGNVTGSSIKIDNMVIAVMKDDPAQSLADAADYTFGIQMTLDSENTQKTLDQISENIQKDVNVQSFDGLLQQVDALYNGTVGAIVYNEAFLETIMEQHPTFSEDVRVLDNVKIETKVEVVKSDKKVTKEPFTLYITGNDAYGDIASSGRSDVNILVTVNPETRQILLTTTPRDYYLEFPGVTKGTKDKLTHAGIYGVDCSMNTLGALYGVDIDYYVKVNFTSVVKIVDQLGGVNVYSEYAFTSIYGYEFQEGWNTIEDGEVALAFVRERKNLPGGDNQRGKNQQAMITAMIKKAMSPAILTNYAGLLSSMNGNFETSLSMDDITELIKMQLNDGGEWNIVSQSVVGFDSTGTCYSSPGYDNLYVMVPDEESVAAASAMIQRVYNGEILENTSPQ